MAGLVLDADCGTEGSGWGDGGSEDDPAEDAADEPVRLPRPATHAAEKLGCVMDSAEGCWLDWIECERRSSDRARGWRGFLVDRDDDGQEDDIVVYCPGCASREFSELRIDLS